MKAARLAKRLRVPTPANRGPGQLWRPGTPLPAPVPTDTPATDIRGGYARCSHLTQELQSQLDALAGHGIDREKTFSEKVSSRVRVRPRFEAALELCRQIKAHAPHCRVILTVYEMKRLGRGLSVGYAYTPAGQVKAITPSGGALPTLSYDYSTGSTDTTLVRKLSTGAAVATYAYTAQNWLAGATVGSTSYGYGYDPNGNPTQQKTGSSTLYQGFNAVNEVCWAGATNGSSCASTPAGDLSYSYDPNGNETGTSNGYAMTYNPKNQTTSITHPGVPAVAMTYADANNTERTQAGNTGFTNGPLGVTTTTDPGATAHYTRDPGGGLLDQRTTGTTTASSDYYTDALASTINLTDATTGAVTATYTYNPYGNTGAATGTAAAANPYRYAGGYYDPQGDGFYHNGARYYSRGDNWTQRDPHTGVITDPTTTNPYIYAGNNPTNYTDLTGSSCAGDIVGAIGGFLGAVASTAGLVILTPETGPLGIAVATVGYDVSIPSLGLSIGSAVNDC